ncbi:hypothetical protein DENSPDRAFT_877730 [Dentipellis sp. KUC8613]|nr:hypothetical protein DENSPDRAFT_877730 [Dentipellis sp. KUC8613]
MFNSWFGRRPTSPPKYSRSPLSTPTVPSNDKPIISPASTSRPTLVTPSENPRAIASGSNLQARGGALPTQRKQAADDDTARQRAYTTALSTPHDAVLAELHGVRSSPDPVATASPTTADPTGTLGERPPEGALSDKEKDGDKLRSRETVLSGVSAALSGQGQIPGGTPQTKSEPLYEPFTGTVIGNITPAPMATGSNAAKAKEELWTQMGTIRALQAEIASMHVTMEGIGLGHGDVGAGRSGHIKLSERQRSASGGGEKLDEMGATEGAEAEAEEAKEEERTRVEREEMFGQAEKRFEGRKEEIDAIMTKLDALAGALAKFHALETPTVDFDADMASRSNTNSTGMSVPTSLRPLHPDVLRLSRLSVDSSMPGHGRSRMGSEGYLLESPASIQSALPPMEDPMDRQPALKFDPHSWE